MSRVHNANDALQQFRRCRANYKKRFGPMVEAIRAKYANGANGDVDESLEAHVRTYVVNELLHALNWRMDVPPENGLPNLTPEAPIYSQGTGTQRFLDYLGFERSDCERPLLVVETKRPSARLPALSQSRRKTPPEAAEVISLGLQGQKLKGDWSDWLGDLRDYVLAVHAKTGVMPKKVVSTNGDWFVVFTDPHDSFAAAGTASAAKILVFETGDAVEQDFPDLFQQLEYSRLTDVREPVNAREVGFCVAGTEVARVMRGVQLLYNANPGIYDPPSPFIKVVPVLFLGSKTGEWLCVRGPASL